MAHRRALDRRIANPPALHTDDHRQCPRPSRRRIHDRNNTHSLLGSGAVAPAGAVRDQSRRLPRVRDGAGRPCHEIAGLPPGRRSGLGSRPASDRNGRARRPSPAASAGNRPRSPRLAGAGTAARGGRRGRAGVGDRSRRGGAAAHGRGAVLAGAGSPPSAGWSRRPYASCSLPSARPAPGWRRWPAPV